MSRRMRLPSYPKQTMVCILLYTLILYTTNDFWNFFKKINENYHRSNINQYLNHFDTNQNDVKIIKQVGYSDSKIIKDYHTVNKTHPCNVTVVVFDPRLTDVRHFKSKQSLFTAIESVATNLHPKEGVCFSIQTSACSIPNNNDPYKAILSNAKPNLYPNFHNYLTDSGRVRISILNTKKYSLQSCNNFMSPNHAWMNVHYWDDEFVNGIDSDLVFFIQDDSVLCEGVDIRRWGDVAMVGAPWPDVHHSVPKPSMCTFLKTKFYSWMKNNVPEQIEFCPKEVGIHGNGGLSIRSRSWIKKAIHTCPHAKYSGLTSEEVGQADCSLDEPVPEDVYFSAILRYLKAPLPTAFEASLFSSEMIVPYQTAYEWWGPKDNINEMKRLAKKRLTDDHYSKFERYIDNIDNGPQEAKMQFIPIGFHNTWFYHPVSFLNYITSQCPDFKIIRFS